MDAIDQVVVQNDPIPSANYAPPPPLPIVHLGVKWVKDNSKWCCKVEDYAEKQNTKWLLIVHLKKMHSLATEKGKCGRLSMHLKGFKQQTHTAMNAKVLNDPIAIMQQNEQKATAHTKIPTIVEWDQLQKIAKDLKEVQNPPLVKVVQDHSLQILSIPTWRYDTIPQDAFSHLQKDEDLKDAITSSRTTSTKKAKVAWDATLWDQETSKTTHAQEIFMHQRWCMDSKQSKQNLIIYFRFKIYRKNTVMIVESMMTMPKVDYFTSSILFYFCFEHLWT